MTVDCSWRTCRWNNVHLKYLRVNKRTKVRMCWVTGQPTLSLLDRFLPSCPRQLSHPLSWGPAKGVRKKKDVTLRYSARGPWKAVDFLSHLSREQQEGQGGDMLQFRYLPTGRMSSQYRTESLMICSNSHRLANSTGKWYAPAFSLSTPPFPPLLFFFFFFWKMGAFQRQRINKKSSVVTCWWCWLQHFQSNVSVTYHVIIKLSSSIFSFPCSPRVHSGWLYYWNRKISKCCTWHLPGNEK